MYKCALDIKKTLFKCYKDLINNFYLEPGSCV